MKKKLFILLMVGIFLTFGLSTGCKKGKDIRGQWNVTLNYPGQTFNITATFTGDKTSGTYMDNWSNYNAAGGTGSYTVSSDTIKFNVTWSNGNSAQYTGTIISSTQMSGTFTETGGATGSWTMTKI